MESPQEELNYNIEYRRYRKLTSQIDIRQQSVSLEFSLSIYGKCEKCENFVKTCIFLSFSSFCIYFYIIFFCFCLFIYSRSMVYQKNKWQVREYRE